MKKRFKDMNEYIRPLDDLSEQVMAKATGKNRRLNLRPLAAVAAVLVLLIAATPVMAENVPLVHDVLNLVAPELADRLVPVQVSDEDNGIQMEVVAASVHDNVAEVVVKIESEDLAGTNMAPLVTITSYRRNTTTEILPLNDYDGAEADKEKGIFYYSAVMTYRDGTKAEEVLGDKMTVKVEESVMNVESDPVEVPVILTDYALMTVTADHDEALKTFCRFGDGYSEGYEYRAEMEEYVLMTPGEVVHEVSDRLSLTGAAFIDGKLHIQTCGIDEKANYATWNYRAYLMDAEGNEVSNIYNNSFGIEVDGKTYEYTEWVFDIAQEDLEDYTLMTVCDEWVSVFCDCSVTFEFTDTEYTAEDYNG